MKRLFSKSKILVHKIYSDRQLWIVVAALGIWMIVLQNFGLFSEETESQSVYVVGGDVAAHVRGSVWVNGGELDVSGSSVRINGGYVSTW